MPVANRFAHRPIVLSPVLIRLLGMLVVFVCAITGQHALAARVDAGFAGPLDHLVVASHNESLRVLAGHPDAGSKDDESSDPSHEWLVLPLHLWLPLGRSNGFHAIVASYPVVPARFLTPLLRAPPLM